MSESIHPESVLRLDRQLCFPLYAASRRIIKLYRPVLEPLGLTYTQYITMLVLWECDAVTVKALGERLFLDSGTLTPLLKKLESQGLVERERDKADERMVIVRLSPAGRALRQRALDVPARIAACVDLPMSDALELHRILHTLLASEDSGACDSAEPEGA